AMINGAAEAIEFYKKAFDALEIFRLASPDGRIIHAEIQIGESVLMVGDADPPFQDPKTVGGTTVGLHVYVDDVDAMSAQAIRAGASEVQPAQDMFYGARQSMV